MANEQIALSFGRGITNVPSDATCDDNELEESLGMVYDNGEHRVIQAPKLVKGDLTGKLLFVHKIPGTGDKNYIVYESSGGGSVKWRTQILCAGNADTKVAAVGKTLIINTGGAVYYALWKGSTYLPLGSRLPEVELRFSMTRASSKLDHPSGETDWDSFNYEVKTVGISSSDEDSGVINSHELASSIHAQYWHHEIRHQDKFNEAMIGIVSAHLNDIKKLKRFCFPFWVRYAVRMYDGSYTCISNPILMMPTVHYNRNAFFSTGEMGYRHPSDDDDVWPATYDPYSAKLHYEVVKGIGSGWSDIVKGVDIFVSEEVRTFNMESNWRILNPYIIQERASTVLVENIYGTSPYRDTVNVLGGVVGQTYDNPPTEEQKKIYTSYILPVQWTEEEYKKRLLEATVFYKLFELDASEVTSSGTEQDATPKIDTMTLPNLTTQTQLGKDDYMSHTELRANIIKTYNSRLHMADLTKGFFGGFGHFSNMIGSSASPTIVVYINTDDGERVVTRTLTNINEDFRYWFYYPDRRAYRAEVYTGGSYVVYKLSEHPALNGAYAFFGLPFSSVSPAAHSGSAPTANDAPERITNRVVVSEVDNPWVFDASGDVTVGSSRIRGLATQTMALGQEEHGLHPLTVFTEDGVYGLHLNKEGAYMQADLFSREVCSNPNGIAETDGAVFFPSAKGLMVVVGREVKCVSEQLSGKGFGTDIGLASFASYLENAMIAYDYRDSLLWIFNPPSEDSHEEYCYVYAIKSGTFAKYYFDDAIENVVNDYPDFLLQHLQTNKNVYSLMERDDINDDPRTYSATILTRPMKLGNALALKSIRQVRHALHFSPYSERVTQEDPETHEETTVATTQQGTMTMKIYASNDLDTWKELPSLRGMPWKYFKFELDFAGLRATDRFAGSVVVTQERRTNKMR